MKNAGAKVGLGVIAGALLLAVALQFRGRNRAQATGPAVRLHAVIPEAVPGWQARDLPLGANEGVVATVRQTLRFDEAVFREFSRGAEAFSVYAAYWRPGKMPVQLVASHTPDRCWTENGWHCDRIRFGVAEHFGALVTQPAQWRLFRAPGGERQYVLYWQLVNGRAYDFGDRFNRIPSAWRWWRDAAQQMLLGDSEQYFIRISSNEPFDQLRTEPGFVSVMQALGRLGLGQPVGKP